LRLQPRKRGYKVRLIDSPRALALKVLESVARRRGSPESLIHDLLAQHPGLARPDRALLLELVQGVLRWQLRLDFVISQVSLTPLKKLHPLILQLLRLTTYQILFLDRIPTYAAVNEAIRLAKSRHLPRALVAFLNATLRKLAKVGRTISLPDRQSDPVGALAVATSHPPWLAARWLQDLGESGAWRRCQANNHIPPLTIRVNTQKISPAKLLALLAQEGVPAQPCRFSPVGLTIQSLEQPPLNLDSYQRGLWVFQDEAAQLVTYLLQVEPGQRVLEIGAGRGTKTTHLVSMLGSEGHLVALDRSRWRLVELGHNLERLRLGQTSLVVADATRPLPIQASVNFDRILIDAPCSGLGTIRRHPELRWWRSEADFPQYATRQLAMLQHAATYLRVGGLLLYITCTTEVEENEAVVEAFLAFRPEFKIHFAPEALPATARHLLEPPGFFRTLPEREGLDGFFAAVLARK